MSLPSCSLEGIRELMNPGAQMRQTPSTQRSPEGQSQLTEHVLPLLGVVEGMQ